MRKILSVGLLLMTSFALTTVARADAIVGPVGMAAALAYVYWPVILVAVLVIVTMVLLKRFKKK